MEKFAREPKLHRASLWIWAFLINLALQIFRGSWSDTIIFSIFTIALIYASRTKRNVALLHEAKFPWIVESALALGFLLLVIPWHTSILIWLFAVLIIVVCVLVWSREHTERMPRTKRMKRAEFTWVVLAVLLAIWEFGANILGIQNNTLYEYPTISILVVPMLDSIFGKVTFVVLWLAMGLGLLRLVRQR